MSTDLSGSAGFFTVDDLLDMPVNATPEQSYALGLEVAVGVGKGNYSRLHSFRNVQSYSMDEVFHDCPRKYQIKKLRASIGDRQHASNPTFAFGHAVGAGVAVYDKTQDLQQAIFAAFLAWNIDLLAKSPPDLRGVEQKDSFAHAVQAIEMYETFYWDEMNLSEYEVVEIEGTVLVDMQNGDESLGAPTQYHTGHVDEVLRHREFGTYKVKENKTTGLTVVHPAMYSNSDQALGYSVVVAAFGGTDYDVVYTIYSKKAEKWVSYDFPKSVLSKAEWIRSTHLTGVAIQDYAAHNFFPTRGSSCYKFNRECPEYGSCQLNLERQFGTKFEELPVADVAQLQQIEPFKYVVTRDELVRSLREHMKTFGADDE
jgi:hypothetical protein